MCKKLVSLISLVLLLVLSTAAQGTDYYVDNVAVSAEDTDRSVYVGDFDADIGAHQFSN